MGHNKLRNSLLAACISQETTYMPTAHDLDLLENVARKYLISTLEGLQPKWTEPDQFLQAEINAQTNLLHS